MDFVNVMEYEKEVKPEFSESRGDKTALETTFEKIVKNFVSLD